MKTVKVAIIELRSGYNEEGYETLIAQSICDWQEISYEDYGLLCGYLPSNYRVIRCLLPDEQESVIIKSVKKGLEVAQKRKYQQELDKEKAKQRAQARLEKKLLKDKKSKLELYEKLKAELDGKK